MRTCIQCGKEITGDRRKVLCSSTCRSRRCRARKAQAKREAELKLIQDAQREQRAQLRVLLEHLAKIAPQTARSVRGFVDINGLDCGIGAVKLALTALHEGARKTA